MDMDMDTRIFGKIEVNPERIITFERGIPGFEALNRFVLVVTEQTRPFVWLQAVDDDIALPLVSPFDVRADYAPEINDRDLQGLCINLDEDLMVYTVAVIPPEVRHMTANFAAPILINAANNRGCQVIVEGDEFPIRQPIYAAICSKMQEEHSDAGYDKTTRRRNLAWR